MVNYATNVMHIHEISIKISIMKEKHFKNQTFQAQTIIVAHCYCTTDTVLFDIFANTMDLSKIITFAYLLIFVKTSNYQRKQREICP